MKAEKAIARIKQETHDISDEYSTERCIQFLNTAIQQVSSLLIAAKYPVLVKEMTMRNGDSIPKNYMNLCGTYPIKMTDGKAIITDDAYKSITIRYFATPDLIEYETDDMPYTHDAINDIIVKTAVLLALNENEYDITQDSNIVEALKQAVSSGMS
jgi:hypothetical protein|nr:MAG TPA: hypothetical protein [Caudoviricetes sp.]